MALRAVRARVTTRDFVVGVTSLAAAVASVSDMASFPPARAAAMVLLVILQTVQEIQTNKDECFRLARRATKILLDLKQRMEGRWESAPAALVENITEFKNVLDSIRDFMVELSKVKWMGRLLQKGAIENSLKDFNNLLDESERSFQLASLIEIHYTVGILQKQAAGQCVDFVEKQRFDEESLESISSPPPVYESDLSLEDQEHRGLTRTLKDLQISDNNSESRIESDMDIMIETETEPVEDMEQLVSEEVTELESLGFKRYHQSEVRLQTAIKGAAPESFWSSTSNADAGGQKSLVKRYEAGGNLDPARRWLHDVKLLKNFYHPNFPQLVGFSDEKAPTPFILLARVKLRDPNAYLWNALQKKTLSECTNIILKMYRDVTSAAIYAQRQLALDENETQDFIDSASYSLDGDGNMVVGLPPPKDKNTVTFRSYRLTESLVSTTMKTLPSSERMESLRGTSESSQLIDLRNKFVHLKALARLLLPNDGNSPELSPEFEEFLEEMDEDEPPSLSRLRELSINAGLHNHAWNEGVHACRVVFSCGDIGYIKRRRDEGEERHAGPIDMTDKTRFNDFVKVGNVFDIPTGHGVDGVKQQLLPTSTIKLDTEKESFGQQTQWVNGFVQRNDVYPIALPGDIEGWPLMLPPSEEITLYIRHSIRMTSVNEAWRYLLREARKISRAENIEPHELILITRSVKGQTYTLRDTYMPPFIPGQSMQAHRNPFGLSMGRPGGYGGQRHGNGFGNAHTFAHHSVFAPPPPKMCYLFTSSSANDFVPFWSENPSAAMMPQAARPALSRSIFERTGWPESYIDYIQLSKEDLD